MKRAWSIAAGVLLVSATGCSKTSDGAKPEGGSPPVGSIASSAGAAMGGSGEAGASSEAGAAANAPSSFQGSYSAKASQLSFPEFAGTKWRGDDAGAALGDGDISLSIDPDGKVAGELKGALGDAKIFGRAEGERVTASVRLDLDADVGWIGTLTGTRSGDKIEGSIQMSSPRANIAREAAFTAKKK